MTAPIPNLHRTDYLDHHGRVYDTVWSEGPPPEPNASGTVVPVYVTEPGQFPLGDCTRTTVFDDRGEPIHTVWAPCPPAMWPPADPGIWPGTFPSSGFGTSMEMAG